MSEQLFPATHREFSRVARSRRGRGKLPGNGPSQPPIATWEPRYRRAVVLSDIAAILTGVLVVGIWLGGHLGIVHTEHSVPAGVGTVLVLLCALLAARTWRSQVLGQGAEEFQRLGSGLLAGAVVLALVALGVNDSDGRPWVFMVVPAIALLAFPQRYLLRRFLHGARQEGRCLLPVIAAGSVETVTDLIERTRKAPHVGWRVEAACTFDGIGTDDAPGEIGGVPVVGRLGEVAEHVRRGGYRIVAVTADAYWSPRRLQQLAWHLEGSNADMVVAPTLMEVAGPRLQVSGVLGMPLLRVTAPTFTGVSRAVKGVFDFLGAASMVLLASPVLLAIAVSIRATSRGPVFYRQRRVGKDGRTFTMVKFRTMVADADKRRATLVADNEGAGPLFKMRRDPRVTRIGALLRRYSLDELPQLLNVLTGDMSLVGPRPPLPEETATYGPDVRRRLLVKPGLTGLWQVSGRSDLPWAEAVRLDLRYVEDWSLALDAVILWKTVWAVLRGEGAY